VNEILFSSECIGLDSDSGQLLLMVFHEASGGWSPDHVSGLTDQTSVANRR
jgi:hypothetical protein